MKKTEIYNQEYVTIFSPTWTEHLWDIISIVKNQDKSLSKVQLKNDSLLFIHEMLKQKILYVGDEWVNKTTIKKWELQEKEIIKKIDEIWFEDADYPDFFNMVWFGFEDWYTKALEEKGMTHTTDWQTFVAEHIGDLQKWIEENRPKHNIDVS